MGAHSGGKNPSKSSEKDSKIGPKRILAMKATSLNFTPLQTKVAAIQNSLRSNVTTSNRFVVGNKNLSDFTDDSTMSVDNIMNNNSTSDDKNVKKIKTNPIIVVGSNVSRIQNICNDVIKSKKFEIKLLSIGIKVLVADKSDFDLLLKELQKLDLHYFMYHTQETKPRKIVLFGLHEMKIEDLRTILAEHDIFPDDIKTLRLRENRLNYDKQAVYLLYFKAGSIKLADLRSKKYIGSIVVKWESYSPSSHNKFPQCRNCQMYGHSSINCNLPTRCAVCAENHKTDDCKKKISRIVLEHKRQRNEEIDKSFLKCANCNENHPASYHGCQARKTYIQVHQMSQQGSQKRQKVSNFQLNNDDFPHLVSQSSTSSQHHNLQQQHSSVAYQSQTNDSMQQFMLSMMTTFNNLIDKLSSMIEQLTKVLGNKQQFP